MSAVIKVYSVCLALLIRVDWSVFGIALLPEQIKIYSNSASIEVYCLLGNKINIYQFINVVVVLYIVLDMFVSSKTKHDRHVTFLKRFRFFIGAYYFYILSMGKENDTFSLTAALFMPRNECVYSKHISFNIFHIIKYIYIFLTFIYVLEASSINKELKRIT